VGGFKIGSLDWRGGLLRLFNEKMEGNNMTQDLSLYTVSDEYVRYLSEFDKKVTSNMEFLH